MDDIKKKFGFDCMHLPMDGEKMDIDETCRMVEVALNNLSR